MKTFSFFIAAVSVFILSAAEPLMRVAVISDTHVTPKPASAFLVREAYKLFRQLKVDAVINCGDIADHYYVEGYKHYRDAAAEAYQNEKLPLEFFAYANHDLIGRRGETQDAIFGDVRKHLRIFHEPESITKFRGYNFITVRQSVSKEVFEKLIVRAVKDTPDKPVFLIDHIPARNTVYDSDTWGSGERRRILDKYPQIVQFSGHIHGTLANELNIWQGGFTAVNVGGLAYWHAVLLGNIVRTRYSDMALIMDVYKDKLVLRRFFAKSKREYQPETPWIVQLPYRPEQAVYTAEKRNAASTAPEFAPDAKVSADVRPNGVTITFPPARHKDGVFYYKMELFRMENNKWVSFSRRDVMGDFDLDPRPEKVEEHLGVGYFDSNLKYKVQITPFHVFGKSGKPVSGEFSVGKTEPASTVVFESRDPMKDCPFLQGLHSDIPVKLDADGYYNVTGASRLIFPDAIWAGPTYTQFRVTIEMHAKQGPLRWTLTMRNPKPRISNGNNRFYTEPGDNGLRRYVIDMYKSNPIYKYYLLIREGSPGKVRFSYIKIERLNEKFSRRKK